MANIKINSEFIAPNWDAVSSTPNILRFSTLSAYKVIEAELCSKRAQKTTVETISAASTIIRLRSSALHLTTINQVMPASTAIDIVFNKTPTAALNCSIFQATTTPTKLHR